jgi:hypothetical protein
MMIDKQMTREELLAARAKVDEEISELYRQYATGGAGPSPKPALREEMNAILAEIDQELAEMDEPNA